MDRYPAYKDSGIKWLGKIPAHWQLVMLRRVVKDFVDYRGQTPEKVDQGIPLITARNVKDGFLDFSESQDFIATEVYKDWMVRGFPEVGDVIVTTEAPLGNVAQINDSHVALAQRLILLKTDPGLIRNDYLKYYFLSLAGKGELQSEATGSTAEGIKASKFKSVLLCVPTLSEQRSIAHYLDRQTAKIDTLITAKQHLLELLTEKRRALITHAVTRGLNPDALLRDSGIEWLGEIPVHWSVEKLKYHLEGIEQGWSPLSDNFPANDDEWGVLKVGAVNGWEFSPNENKRLPPELEPMPEYEIKPGDVLISRANTTELLGSASLVGQVRSKLLLCDKLYRLKMCGTRLRSDYLVAYLRSVAGHFVFERDATGASSSMQNISQEAVTHLWIPIPPLREQSNIVAHIKAEHFRLESLEIAVKKVIELLQERRVALISAAVTGQIRIPT